MLASRPLASPRLSILHLLLWSTMAALYLAAVRWLLPHPPQRPGHFLLLAALATYMGAAWTALAVTLQRRCVTRDPAPLSPGLWWGASVGAVLLLDLLLRASDPQQSTLGGLNVEVLYTGLTALALTAPALAHRSVGDWSWLFLVVGGWEACQLITLRWPEYAPPLGVAKLRAVTTLTVLVGLIAHDYRRGRRRDVWHVLGVMVGVVWLLSAWVIA